MADDLSRVVPLDELDDFKVADGDPDVRGWEVLASGGRRIGKVDDLLIDRTAMKVRYLDVDLDDDLLETGDDRHILIPIGYARLDEDEDQVSVPELAIDRLGTIPAYTRDSLTREHETDTIRSYDPTYTVGGDLYEHRLYDSDSFYGSRRGT